MQRYKYSAPILEWIDTGETIVEPQLRSFKGRGGWLDRIRKWLWDRWSSPWTRCSYELKRATVDRDRLQQAVPEAIDRMGLRLKDIAFVVVSHRTAMHLKEEAVIAFGFHMDIAQDMWSVRGIPIVVLPWYEGEEILIVPNSAIPRAKE